MGALNPFSAPKMPQPVPVTPPSTTSAPDTEALSVERKRRSLAVGSAGNIVSSLSGATSDASTTTARKTLLGG